MGRKRSIDTRIQGKSLREVKRELRLVERRVIEDATRAAGEIGVAIYRANPEHSVFSDYPEFERKIEELSSVLGKINVELRIEKKTAIRDKKEITQAKVQDSFVRDVDDNEL